MPLMQKSSVRMARAEDEVGSVTLTASVTPPEQAVNLKWTKAGEGFDISPSGASCTVTGNDSFDGYDTSGTVKAELGSTETIVGSSDTCAITVVKDKGNLIDMSEFTTSTKNGVTCTREIANKYVFSGTSDVSTSIAFTIGRQTLEDGIYSLAKTDYNHFVTNGSGQPIVQLFSPSGGNLYGSNKAALANTAYNFNIQIQPVSAGDTASGYINPFLTKLADSGQLLGTADLTTSTEGWAVGQDDNGDTFRFEDGSAVYTNTGIDAGSNRIRTTTSFIHEPGHVYGIFFDAKLDTAGSISVGELNGASATFNLTTEIQRYARIYTATAAVELSIVPKQIGTLTISNIKLVEVTVTSDMDSQTTLDEPRFDTGLDLDPGLSLL